MRPRDATAMTTTTRKARCWTLTRHDPHTGFGHDSFFLRDTHNATVTPVAEEEGGGGGPEGWRQSEWGQEATFQEAAFHRARSRRAENERKAGAASVCCTSFGFGRARRRWCRRRRRAARLPAREGWRRRETTTACLSRVPPPRPPKFQDAGGDQGVVSRLELELHHGDPTEVRARRDVNTGAAQYLYIYLSVRELYDVSLISLYATRGRA